MIKKDLILYAFVGGLIVAGIYIIGVDYANEQQEQYNESKQVALNWSNVNATQATCDEMQAKMFSLSTETFDGKELITDAIKLKYQEFEC